MSDKNPKASVEKQIYSMLNDLCVQYNVMTHEAAATITACAGINAAFGDAEHCKNLFLANRRQTRFFLLMMAGHKKFRTAEVSKQIGQARLSFGSDDDLARLLHIRPGAVSPLGLLFDQNHEVDLLIDEDLLNKPFILVHPGVNTATVRISMDDFKQKILNGTDRKWQTVRLS